MATDYKSIFKDFNPATPEKEVLDMQGSRMAEVFKGFKPAEPSVAPETLKEVTAQPVGRPAEAPVAPAGVQPEAPVDPAEAFGRGFGQIPELQPIEELPTTQQHMYAAGAEWATTEALPTALGVAGGFLAAPLTGGMSMVPAVALVAAGTGLGAATGEAVEQTLKMKGALPLGVEEEAPRDVRDILERSAWKGGEEALWSLIPDLVTKGGYLAGKKMLFAGGQKAVDELGNTLDIGKQNLIDFAKEYADEHNLEFAETLLTSDVTDAAAAKYAEDIVSNSYLQGKQIRARQAVKGEIVKEKIKKTMAQYTDPLKNTAGVIEHHVGASFDGLNDFGVATLVNSAFTKAEDAKASVAKGIYNTIGSVMEGTKKEMIYREVGVGVVDPVTGKEITRHSPIETEAPAFPVDLTGLIAIGDREIETSLFGVDSIITRTAALPPSVDFNTAADNLKKLRALQRGLKKSTSEEAPMKSRVVNELITSLDTSLETTAKAAEKAGITMPDGSSVYDAKRLADSVWREKTEDFKNKYVKAILDNTNLTNGSPEKLSQLFIKNEVAAKDIMKVINEAKTTLPEGSPELTKILDAENAIKGSVMQEILAPVDPISGEFLLPQTKYIKSKAKALKQLYGDEGFAEIQKLGTVLDSLDKRTLTNHLGFVQKARESGMVLQTLKNFLNGDRNILGPLFKEGMATLITVCGGKRILTNNKNIQYLTKMYDPRVPDSVKLIVAKKLSRQLVNFQESWEATATPEERERVQMRDTDQNEYRQLFKSQE